MKSVINSNLLQVAMLGIYDSTDALDFLNIIQARKDYSHGLPTKKQTLKFAYSFIKYININYGVSAYYETFVKLTYIFKSDK